MKTEEQIAGENVNGFLLTEDKQKHIWIRPCIEHRESCKRFLHFLEEVIKNHKITGGKDASVPSCIPVKIEDLKKAIKLYDNGL